MAFIERTKAGSRNVVIFKYAALYYWMMWPTIFVSFAAFVVHGSLFVFLSIVMWVVLIALAAPYWSAKAELTKVMREKPITASGSKYSLVNPLRYEWGD